VAFSCIGKLIGAALGSKLNRGGGKRKSYKKSSHHKRAAEDDIVAALSPALLSVNDDGQEVIDLEPTFRALEELDVEDCAKVYVCEVAAKDPATLNETEAALVAVLFGNEEINLASAMSTYQLAAR